MASELAQMLNTLKSQRSAVKFLLGLTDQELRAAIRAVVEPDKWSETAETARFVSVRLEELARALEIGAEGEKT